MAIILIRFFLAEIRQLSESAGEYFSEWNNYIDILFILTMGPYIAINMIY